jgi:hypothetical protein
MHYSSLNSGIPRQISRGLKAKIVFSNPRAWIGAVFLGMGLLFTAIFAPMSDLNFSNPLDISPSIATGTIHTIEQTSATENKKRIYRFDFDYFVDEQPHYGSSYYRGNSGLNPGDQVEVEYDKNNPGFARIKNFRMAPFNGDTFLIMLIFPVSGFLLVILAIRKARKNIMLVRTGYVTTGRVVSKEATNSRVNKRRVYKIGFEYTGTDGMTRHGSVRTHQPERLEDEENELLLFNPDQPDEAVMLDALPKAVRRFLDPLPGGVAADRSRSTV